MLFLNKNTNFNKNGIKNATHALEKILVLQLIQESQIRRKRKKECIFCNVYFVRSKFILTFLLLTLNKFSEYI